MIAARIVAIVAAIACVMAAAPARADNTPWSTGVSDDTQARANALFAEANDLFAQQKHAPALDKYRAAVALWNHPMIQFNMAVTLIHLDRVLEADEALDEALRFGAVPFTPELYQQALAYKLLLRGRVGTIAATCTQAATQVMLDGNPWFRCPGVQQKRVLAGPHEIVGERAAYLTTSKQVLVAGGETAHQLIALVPIDGATLVTYPQPRWMPYGTLGGGAAIGVAGVVIWLVGRNGIDQYRTDLQSQCPSGCVLATGSQLADERHRAQLEAHAGTGLMIGGGAVAVGGAVWAWLDARGKRVIPLEVAPPPDGAGAVASYRAAF
jgi:hypothetical protein